MGGTGYFDYSVGPRLADEQVAAPVCRVLFGNHLRVGEVGVSVGPDLGSDLHRLGLFKF